MIDKSKIIALLNTIPEHQMAKDIFIPLFQKKGMKGVRFTGGADELGIDIEYYQLTDPDNKKSYCGIQFKKGDIKYGATGAKGTVKELKNQAEEAFEKEIHDIEGSGVHYINRFIVATTGDINEKARTYIGRAKIKGDSRNIDFWLGDRLAEYIQQDYMKEFSEYFSKDLQSLEPVEIEQIVDSDYIEENFPDLVSNCQKIERAVSRLEWSILRNIAINHGRLELSDLLLELGYQEEYIREELNHLARLNFLYEERDEDGVFLFLGSKSSPLNTLIKTIDEELSDADEQDTDSVELFDTIIG